MTEDASLEQLGKEIMARLKAAERAAEKADQHSLAAGLQLIQAREKTGEAFPTFLKNFCPSVKRSRAYQLIAIAGGKTTVAAERTKTAERVRKHRAAKAATTEPAPTDSPLRNGQPGETAQAKKNSPEWLLGEVSFFINVRFPQMDAATLAKAKAMVAAWEPAHVQEAA
jgi:hypothetical protein